MGDASVLWADASDDEGDESDETEAHGAVDETFAERRLRRWLRGMFGGRLEQPDEPDDGEET
jgi:hypothetical protein